MNYTIFLRTRLYVKNMLTGLPNARNSLFEKKNQNILHNGSPMLDDHLGKDVGQILIYFVQKFIYITS